ncbi:MAG: LPS export ABC transporter permease LptG [Hyphomicrobiaceae bacterium]|nr:LPS export ABC transporter permease LptG [Hyphomicrobiaceae bacterium]
MPSILARYIGRTFLVAIVATFSICALLVFMIDMIELLRLSGKYGNVPLLTLLGLAALRLPTYTEFLLSFTVLVGAIAALMHLSRRSELTIMRASGMSVWQFLRPGMAVAFGLGLFSMTLYNPLAAASRTQAELAYAEVFGRDSNLLDTGTSGTWLRQNGADGQSVMNAGAASERGLSLKAVTAIVFDDKGIFKERVDARSARLMNGYWRLEETLVARPGEPAQRYDTYLLSTYLTPERATEALSSAYATSFWDLPNLIEDAEKASLQTNTFRIQYELLLARPLLCVAMVLLAATVSLKSFRSGGIQTMVVAGMIGGFGFFLLAEISRQLGLAGLAPAWAAAWLPVSLAMFLSLTVLMHQEDG